MASEILARDHMAYAGSKPWHGLGTALPGIATAAEMIEAARLDWEVELIPLVAMRNGVTIPTNSFSVTRKDCDESLGVVGNRYAPIQNKSQFSFFDNIVDKGQAIYHTAGSLFNGKKVWVLAKLPEDMIIWRTDNVKDVTQKYILLSNTHDGSGALKIYFTPIRVVCNNTLTASAGTATNKVSIRHTVSAEDKLAEAHKLMGFTTHFYEEMQKQQQYLANSAINEMKDFYDFLQEIWPDTTAEKSRAQKTRDAATSFFVEEAETYGADWLSAVNAVTGLIDHGTRALPEGKEELRADKILFGSGALLKERAFEVAMKFAERN